MSIGCGDGTFDAIVLQAMINKYPGIKICYTVIGIDEDTCQRAMKELSPLKTDSGKVEINVLNMDMNSLNAEIRSVISFLLCILSTMQRTLERFSLIFMHS